jgi:hypothetical protein
MDADPKRLHAVTHRADLGHNRYCGPAAVSIITGRTAECAVRWMLVARGYEPGERNGGIKGSWATEVGRALHALGYKLDAGEDWLRDRPTLARWLRDRTPAQRARTYLVSAGHHFLVVRGNKIACSLTGAPVNLRAYPHRRYRVRHYYRVTLRADSEGGRLRRLRTEPMPEGVR